MKKSLSTLMISTLLISFSSISPKVEFGKVEGNVFEIISKEEILYCNVLMIGTSYKTFTDLDGHFILDSIMPGKYTLCAFNLGYDTTKVELEVASGQKIIKDIYLDKSIQILTTDPLEDKIPR